MITNVCAHCRGPMPEGATTRRGRPRRFCGDVCRREHKRLEARFDRKKVAALRDLNKAERKAADVLRDPFKRARVEALKKANGQAIAAAIGTVDTAADVGNRLTTGVEGIVTCALAELVHDFADNPQLVTPDRIVRRVRDRLQNAREASGDYRRADVQTTTAGGDVTVRDRTGEVVRTERGSGPRRGRTLDRRSFPVDTLQQGEELAGVLTAALLGVSEDEVGWLDPAGQDATDLAERRRRMDRLPVFGRLACIAWVASGQSPETMARLSARLRGLGWSVSDEQVSPEWWASLLPPGTETDRVVFASLQVADLVSSVLGVPVSEALLRWATRLVLAVVRTIEGDDVDQASQTSGDAA